MVGRLAIEVRRDESGITLIELLVSMLIGTVVMIGVLTLLDAGAHSATRTLDRADVTQRGRTAMNGITRFLRSQVCRDPLTPPIVSGTASSMTFYTDTDSSDAFTPQAVKLTLDTTWKGGRGAIIQDVYPGTDTTARPAERVLVEDVAPVPGTPFLNYFSFDSANAVTAPLSPTTTGDPLPANSIAKILRTDIAFRVYPSRPSGYVGPINGTQAEAPRDSDFTSSVYVRNSDYTDQAASNNDRTWGPRCS